jgi:hypothetical protein
MVDPAWLVGDRDRAMSDFEYDAYVLALRNANVGLEAATREANRKFGRTSSSVAIADVDDDALEDTHAEEADKTMRALGFEVVRLSQKRRSKVTEGIPDRKYYHRGRKLTFWYESKATWGRQSPAQREFQQMAIDTGELYALGTYDDLVKWLVDHKLATIENGVLEPIPQDGLPF